MKWAYCSKVSYKTNARDDWNLIKILHSGKNERGKMAIFYYG